MPERSTGAVVAVVDDDQSILRSIGDLLESADYQVRVFTSGAALLESECLPTIGCLISDVDMPGMDGFELLRRIQKVRLGLPTILITGYPETLKRSPLADGTQPRILTKPFEGLDLLTAVSESLGSSPQ
jgi:FixJ family two-component response regulator